MSEYDDDPLVRALRAPGSPDELAREAEAVAAFRAGVAAPGRARRALGRLGVGSSALVLSITLGGGVAAAYTQTLPAPVQDFAHGVLGPVGVPPSRAREPQRTPPSADPGPSAPAPADPPTSLPDGSTSPEPGEETTSAAPGGGSSPTPPPGQPSPTADPTAEPTADPGEPSEPAAPTSAPTASPSAEPTAPPGPVEPTAPPTSAPSTDPEPSTPPVPTDVSIAVSADRAEPGAVVTLTGTVTDEQGAAVPDRNVRLAVRTSGGTWTVVASTRTDSGGVVSFASPPLTESLRVRLALRRIVSESVRVSLAPTVELAASAPRAGRVRLTASVAGGQEGDTVRFLLGSRELGTGVLAADGTASLSVPARDRRTVYAVRLPATLRHLRAEDSVVWEPPVPDSPSSPPTPRVAS